MLPGKHYTFFIIATHNPSFLSNSQSILSPTSNLRCSAIADGIVVRIWGWALLALLILVSMLFIVCSRFIYMLSYTFNDTFK